MRNITAFILVFAISLGLSYLEVNLTVILLTALLIVTVFIFMPYYHSVFLQTDVDKIEKFLLKNKRQPIYQYYYGLANKNDQDVEEGYARIKKKYKKEDKRAVYDITYALYHQDLQSAKNSVEKVKVSLYKDYYRASIAIEERRFPIAMEIIEDIPQEWMAAALKAEIELRTKKRRRAVPYAEQALEKARGLQRYVLFQTYRRELPELGLE